MKALQLAALQNSQFAAVVEDEKRNVEEGEEAGGGIWHVLSIIEDAMGVPP